MHYYLVNAIQRTILMRTVYTPNVPAGTSWIGSLCTDTMMYLIKTPSILVDAYELFPGTVDFEEACAERNLAVETVLYVWAIGGVRNVMA